MNEELFVKLMKHFHKLGWMTGSSGAMACCTALEQIIYSPLFVQIDFLEKYFLF